MMRVAGWLTGVAMVAGVAGAGQVRAQSAVAQVDALRACGTIEKKSARLACYDAMASAGISAAPAAPAAAAPAPMASAPSVSYAPAPAAPPPAQAAASPARPSGFGAETVRTPAARAAEKQQSKAIEAQVVSARDNGVGHWVIVLSDGARWQMTEAGSNFQPPRPGDTVRIRRGALGSYRMDVGSQAAVGVARIG